MKILRSSLMALTLFVLAGLWSCGSGNDPSPLTFLQRVSGTWTINGQVRVNGTADASINTSGFSVTFNENGSFSVSLGSLPEDIKPNAGVANSGGTWSANGTSTITFTDGTGSNTVTLSNLSPASDTEALTNVTVTFNAEVDKVDSSVAMDLVKR